MRQTRIWIIWILFLAEAVVLATLPAGQPKALLAYEPGMSLRARSEQTAEGVRFTLENLSPEINPSLSVTVPSGFDPFLRCVKTAPTTFVATLPAGKLADYPALQLRYTWLAGAAELRGQHLYVNPAFPYDWKVQQYDLFTVYHVGPYLAARMRGWAEIYRWLADSLLVQPGNQAVYLMPGVTDLPRALRLSPGEDPRLAGLWVESAGAVMLAPLPDSVLTATMAHELSHALLYNRNPIWWEEGIATWLTHKEAQHRTGANTSVGWKATEVAMQGLHQVARETQIALSEVDQRTSYPLDRYTVGSSFVLYVRSRIGEPGVLMLAAAAAERSLEAALREILDESMEEAEQRWLAYIRSDRFLEDAAIP